MVKYTLGPLPWSENILRQAYFGSVADTQRAIQEHPGFSAHNDLCALRLSLDIFLDSVSDLFQSIDTFRIDAQSPGFWTRPARTRFESRELAVRRGVFAAATSAKALVDHSCIVRDEVQKRVAIMEKEYERQRKESFDDNEHKFIQKLRDYVSHFRMIEADWQMSYSASGKRTQFLLRREVLLQGNKWGPQARTFIDDHPNGIDIEKLFNNYRTRVLRFHKWFHNQIAQISEPELSEYREYERMLKRFSSRAMWNLILEQVVIRRLDPFTYLDRYLTKAELDEALALPRQSRVQIDRIIEILDEYGACDEKLREKVYRAFGADLLVREA